jgi:hypothetical protein
MSSFSEPAFPQDPMSAGLPLVIGHLRFLDRPSEHPFGNACDPPKGTSSFSKPFSHNARYKKVSSVQLLATVAQTCAG